MLIAVLKMMKPRVRRASSSRRIKGADLRRNIALQKARADDEQQQGQQE